MPEPVAVRGSAGLWEDPLYSDVVVTVGPPADLAVQPLSGNKRKAQSGGSEEDEAEPFSCKQFRLHAAILVSGSSYMETMLRRWAAKEIPARIHVRAGSSEEVAGVEDVFWALYHDNKLPDSTTFSKCLGALKTADELGAARVLTAAQEWLGTFKFSNRSAANALYALPKGLLDCIPEPVKAGAQQELLEGLRDLEVTLAGDGTSKRMLDLPEEVFAALLSDDQTLVAHESTIAYAAMLYADKTLHADHVPDSLAHCVRLKRLSPAYAGAVASAFPQWTARVMAVAAACRETPDACKAVCAEGDALLLAALGNISTDRRPSANRSEWDPERLRGWADTDGKILIEAEITVRPG
ncbi:hypothetical protein JKP88DRAFT_284879 [Tribonema minus]|uniref:BTB domain-containing protein n=1 Tax=Tribonema minus TaxID=303371 RepID=A0A835ZDN4_9STRA|nr:hypothetical protein JKP88DRAFT_284879 [Tribonema minus]